jgi:D-alanyl-lipoteichoic acid acyltransferase DltB (MBOAT superfamily)
MLFNSLHFFVFLIVVFIVSAILRRYTRKAEIWFLVIASAYFYGQWNWTYLLLIYVTIITDYFLGLKCYRADNPQYFLNISLLVNLGILGFFKHANFLISSSNNVLHDFGSSYYMQLFDILLPVGISFYTFQSLSYTIDIYRGELKPRKSFSDYALFVSFFPQLVAGPIVRASEFFEQLDKKRCFSFAMAQSGVMLILLGLVKKVVFADNLATFSDPIFNHPQGVSGIMSLMAVYAFAFQIYFDFSGYTDIAIGVAKLLGFTFPKNFNHPYISLSIQDFWRRWHMTLSRWLRDYLYISLGGNRLGSWLTMRNLFLTMFLGGLWHGASWNFAFWGVLHGLYLAAERLIDKYQIFKWNLEIKALRLFKWLLIFHLICFAWVFFRAQTFTDSWVIINNITTMTHSFSIPMNKWVAVIVICCLPVLHWLTAKMNLAERSASMGTFQYVSLQTLFILMLVFFYPDKATSFMYFQF